MCTSRQRCFLGFSLMVRWVCIVRAQHPLGGRGQWVGLRDCRMKLCCDMRMLCFRILLVREHCFPLLFVNEPGDFRASRSICLCPVCILVGFVPPSCQKYRYL